MHGRANTARSLASAPTFGLFALPALRGVASAAWHRPHDNNSLQVLEYGSVLDVPSLIQDIPVRLGTNSSFRFPEEVQAMGRNGGGRAKPFGNKAKKKQLQEKRQRKRGDGDEVLEARATSQTVVARPSAGEHAANNPHVPSSIEYDHPVPGFNALHRWGDAEGTRPGGAAEPISSGAAFRGAARI